MVHSGDCAIAHRILNVAKKAMKDTEKLNDSMGRLVSDPHEAYDTYIKLEMKKLEDECRLGCEIELMRLRIREEYGLGQSQGRGQLPHHRWHFVTVRPPHGYNWYDFYNSCQRFIEKWQHKWNSAEWCYEQKGESEETMGHGFHLHLLFSTIETNYYKSHILRDTQRHFTYVKANCIQVEPIPVGNRLEKCRRYMRGDKPDPEKLKAVEWDRIWRTKMSLPDIIQWNKEADGQVQSVSSEDNN